MIIINDLVDKISSTALIYADDAKAWRFIKSGRDALMLQREPTIVTERAVDSGLKLDLSEFHVMNIPSHLIRFADAIHGNYGIKRSFKI